MHYALKFASLASLLLCAFSAIAEIKIPVKKLKDIVSLPDSRPLLLESRYGLHEFIVLEVSTGLELRWNASGIGGMAPMPDHCGAGAQMLSWANQAEKVLIAQCGSAYLFSRDGTSEALRLKMPGNLDPYVGMSQYSLSSDAKYISYTLYTRDPRSKELYQDLMVQETAGSPPIKVTTGYTDYMSALSPDGSLIAYSAGSNVKIAKLSGEVVFDVKSPNAMLGPEFNRIQELRWSPDGSKLAARISNSIYLLNISEIAFNAIVRDKSNTDVTSMAWSPDGEELAFRSTYEGEETCSYGPQFSGGVIVFHTCASGYRLYSVNIATGQVRRLKTSTVYSPGALLWIR